MPTYDYKCNACGHRFDELQSFSEPPLTKCPACKKNKLERLFGGGGAIIFKGSGFYETDYRKDSYKNAEKAETDSSAPKMDAKGEASSGADAAKPAAEPAPSAGADTAAKPTSSPKPASKGGGKKTK